MDCTIDFFPLKIRSRWVPATDADTVPSSGSRVHLSVRAAVTQSQTTKVSSTGSRRRRTVQTGAIAVAAGAIAVFAPLTLTGVAPVDAVERGLFVAALTFIGSHGRRRAWLYTGAILAVAARELALLLVVIGLAASMGSTVSKRRDKRFGAVAAACFANAIVWLPGHCWSKAAIPAAVVAITTLVVSGAPNMPRRHRRIAGRSLAVVAVFVLVGFLGAGFSTMTAFADVNSGSAAARRALVAVRDGDTDTARKNLETAQQHLAKANDKLSGPAATPARLVPVLAQQMNALEVSVAQALAVTETADDLLTTSYEDLRYDGRVDLDRLIELEEPSSRVTAVLANALEELDALHDHWIAPPLRTKIDELGQEIQTAHDDAAFANQVLTVAPDLLGNDGPRYYLVAFITPAELRGAGGFVGSWAELEADDGRVDLTRSGRIAELIFAPSRGTRTLEAPADYVARYGRLQPQEFIQDITVSPNFPSSAEAFANTYAQSGGRPVDGVISVDPTGLAALLTLTGPVDVIDLEEPLTSDNVVDILTKDQYLRFGERAEREDVLADASRATFEKLTNTALPAPKALGDALGPATHGRHIQMWSREGAEQNLFETLEADGTLAIPAGSDGFQVVQQNAGNNKIDAYLQREIAYEASVDADTGAVTGTLTVTLHNDVPSVPLPDVVMANSRAAPRGTNVTTIAVHTRNVVTAASIDGKPVVMGRGEEAGMFAWDTPLLQVPPGGKVTLVLTMEGTVEVTDGYRLVVLPQPVANPDQFAIDVQVTEASAAAGPNITSGALAVDASQDRPIDVHMGFAPKR